MSTLATLETIQSLIEKKDFKAAAEQLKDLPKDHQQTSAWQESLLADVYFNVQDYGNAVFHTQNLVLLDRFNSVARNNLKKAQQSIEGNLGTTMQHPADWGFELSTWVHPAESLSVSFLLLNCFLFFRFFKKTNFKRDLILISLTSLFLVISGLGFYGKNIGILTQQTELKRQPLESSSVLRSLPSGSRVRFIRNSGNFTEVERSGSQALRGWIKKNELHLFYK